MIRNLVGNKLPAQLGFIFLLVILLALSSSCLFTQYWVIYKVVAHIHSHLFHLSHI